MPRQANGTYQLPPGVVAVSGTPILPAQHNDVITDLGNEVTASVPRDGRVGMTGDLPLFQNASQPLHAVPKQQLDTAIAGAVTDNSVTNAKLADMAQATVKGRAVGAGTGDPVDLAMSSVGAGRHSIWVPAAAMVARVTNGAAPGVIETAAAKVMLRTLDFDASTAEFVQFSIRMPKGWNEGSVSFAASWSHAATVTNFGVAWTLAGLALSDDDALDTAFGTAVTVTDTGGTTDDLYASAESAAVTIGGSPGEGDLVIFQVGRDPANGADTMTVDARLHGILLIYTTNANTDD